MVCRESGRGPSQLLLPEPLVHGLEFRRLLPGGRDQVLLLVLDEKAGSWT